MWQSLLTMTLRVVLHRLQTSSLAVVPRHLNILGSTHNTAHDNHFFVQYLHWASQPPTGYRATTRKQAHRASNAFSMKTVIQGWHQGWQRKTYCFCHLRNLHLRSKKKKKISPVTWLVTDRSELHLQHEHKHDLKRGCMQYYFPQTPFHLLRGHRLPLSTPAPWLQHAIQSTPSNIKSHPNLTFMILTMPCQTFSPTGSWPIMQQATGNTLSC